MAFFSFENSTDNSAPVELYTFTYGLKKFYYTSADEDVTVGATVYTAIALKRSRIERVPDLNRQNIDIETRRDFLVAGFFKLTAPATHILLRIDRYHRDDPDQEVVSFWHGRIMSCSWSGIKATLQCEPTLTSTRLRTVHRHYQRACHRVLYSGACGVQEGDYRVVADVLVISGLTITAIAFGAQSDGYWSGGYIAWADADGLIHNRFIKAHQGNDIAIDQQLPELKAGDQLDASPGCQHNFFACHNKFANSLNYGGFRWLPVKNPFAGVPVF